MSEHTHKCGFDLPDNPFDMAKTDGCGFEWQHDPEAIPEDAMVQAHMCPQCKKGPWSWQYVTETIAERRRRFQYQQFRLCESLADTLAIGDEDVYKDDKKYLDVISKILNDEKAH